MRKMRLRGLKPAVYLNEILSGHFSFLPAGRQAHPKRMRFFGRECIISLLAAALIGVSGFLYAQGALQVEEARKCYEKGQRYYNGGRYKEAVDEFQKALDIVNSIPEEDKKTGSSLSEELPFTEYCVDIDDTLDISVWKIPDLSRSEVIVRPDGKISLPLIGDIETAGRTLTAVDEELTVKYAEYVRQPQISVMIRRFGGKKVIVLGDVARPGVYSFTSDIRVMEAIALAGDCTKYAVKNKILVIRGDVHNNPKVLPVNLIKILRNAKLSENIAIHPQDIIFVPRTFIGNAYSFLETIYPLVDAAFKGKTTQVFWRSDGGQKPKGGSASSN